MFEPILHGVKPTELFKKLIISSPTLTNGELASQFLDFFENIHTEAREVIWHWQRPNGRRGLSDDIVDSSLVEMLHTAGYDTGG